MARSLLKDDYLIYTLPANQTEDEFIQVYKQSAAGINIRLIPVTETAIYDEAKARALRRCEEHPETQFDFYSNEYCFHRYDWNPEIEDFVQDPQDYKIRIFLIPHNLDINSF